MDDETWMTAQAAVASGFAERVITPEGDEADVAANFAPILARFRNVPRQIAARYAPDRVGRMSDDGATDRRRDISHRRTLERHRLDFETMNRNTLELHALQLANMRARDALIPDDEKRRRTMAAHARELSAWRRVDYVEEDYYDFNGFLAWRKIEAVDRSEERRRKLRQHDVELGRTRPASFDVGIQL
jgi:hypothetical protein